MKIAQQVSQDLQELLGRISEDGLVLDARYGAPDNLATAFVIPTLAERGCLTEANRLTEGLAKRRDPEGGWDDPQTTMIAVEAFTALCLRGLGNDNHDKILTAAIRVLKEQPPIRIPELELRLARALVLYGLAQKDSTIIDAGMLRARSVLDRGFSWSSDLDTALHGLLALTDLGMIANDEASREIVRQGLKAFHILDETEWEGQQESGELARVGIVLEKMALHSQAERCYQFAWNRGDAENLNTIDLKHRIELGARLLTRIEDPVTADAAGNRGGDPAEIEAKGRGSSAQSPIQPSQMQENEIIVEDLPALQQGYYEQKRVSVILLQNDNNSSINSTYQAIRGQGEANCEVILATASNEEGSPESGIETDAWLHFSPRVSTGRRLAAAIGVATGEWVWIVPAGVEPVGETLSALLAGSDRADVVHLSAYSGQVSRLLADLRIQPAVRPEHLLVRRTALSRLKKTESWRGMRPWWPLVVENLLQVAWNEVIHPDLDAWDAAAHDSAPDTSLLEELPSLYHAIPSRDPEERAARRGILDERRAEVYNSLRAANRPLVSIIVTGNTDQEIFLRTIQALIEHTATIPFEVIVVLDPALSETVGTALEHLGVLLLTDSNNQSGSERQAMAVEKALGEYFAFVDASTEVQAGWMTALYHAACEEGADVTGGYLQYPDGKVAHAGIAFDESSRPMWVHLESTNLLPSLYQRRVYQAVDGRLVLVSRNCWEQVGGAKGRYDEQLDFVDFCLRSRYLGFRIVYEPKARATCHQHQMEVPLPDEWIDYHAGKVGADVDAYAHLDGYRSVREGKNVRFVPLGRSTAPGRREPEEDAMNEQSSIKSATGVAEKDQDPLHDLLSRAETLIKDGKFDIAEEALVKARQQVNGNVRNRVMYWTLLGDARFRLNRSEEAYACYRKAVSDDPSAERAWIGIATYHLVNGELEEADGIFTKVSELNPANMRAYLGKGNVELRRGASGSALELFCRAASLEPGYRPAIVGLVAAAVQAEDMNAARSPLQAYLTLHPDDVEARFHLAAVLYGDQQLDAARLEAIRVLETRPDHKGARELLDHIPGDPGVS